MRPGNERREDKPSVTNKKSLGEGGAGALRNGPAVLKPKLTVLRNSRTCARFLLGVNDSSRIRSSSLYPSFLCVSPVIFMALTGIFISRFSFGEISL